MTYQSFLTAMMTTADAKLVKADPVKLAEKYQVNPGWVKMCLEHWLRRSRV